jgi:hypothetical protein
MRINRGLLNWGLFFVVLGGVSLAVRQGVVGEETVSQAWTLWPILLILWGVGLILRRTPIEPLTGVAAAATFGLIVGGVLASGSVPLASCGDEQGARPFALRSGELGTSAQVELELNCGELTVRATQGTQWTIEGVDEDGAGPRIDASPNRLEIDSGPTSDVFDARDRWTVALPTETGMDLETRVNAGANRLELNGLNLRRLDVGVNAGELSLDLGGVAALGELEVTLNAVGNSRIVLPNLTFSGSVQANAAGGIRLCAPTGVGLRLTAGDSVASSNNYGSRGLVQDGNVWETPDYDAASTRIDLRTQANAGSFQLEPEGACDA